MTCGNLEESWILTKTDKKWLQKVAVWIWRRMLKISWKNKVTNASVLEKVKKERYTRWIQSGSYNTDGWGMCVEMK